MFALLGIVCFLRQRCASGGRFPRSSALGSWHVVLSIFEYLIGYGRAADEHILSATFPRRGVASATYRCFLDRPVCLSGVPLFPANQAPAPLLYAHCPVG